MLTSAHPPDDDRIFYKEARSLAKAGCQVVVVAPSGKRLPEEKGAVKFAILPENRNVLARLWNLVRIYKTALVFRPEVCHCHEPDALLVGVLLKWRHGTKLIFDSHELWTGVVEQRCPRLLGKLLAWLYGCLEVIALRRCDVAVGATKGITENLAKTLGRDRVFTLLNVPVPEVYEKPNVEPPRNQFVLCHDGVLTFDRGLKVMVEAAHFLSRRHPVVFRIIGDVFSAEREWLEAYVREHRLENVIQRTGWLAYEKVGAALAGCHLGMVAFTRKPNHVIAAPNKIFNYLLYGIPFIGPDFMVELQRMATVDKCCLTADCTSAGAIEETIESLILDRPRLSRMAARALDASKRKYRWEHMENELWGLYRRVLADDLRRPD